MTLSLRVTPPGGSSFLEDYLAGAPALLPFFSGHPLDLGGYRRKLEEVRGRFADRESRARAAAALTPATPLASARLERFVRQGGAMVTTGQQAGLFGGPLYTIHKILTAVRLAETLERELETLVIPVFWIASEDHDFAEVNHAYAVDPDGDLVRVGVTARDPRPFPMNRTRFAEDIAAAVDAYLGAIGADPDLAARLRRGPLAEYRADNSVSGAFRHLILELFGEGSFENALCVTTADDPALKAASIPVLLREAARAAEHAARVAERTERLGALGHAPQVTLAEGSTHLFVTSDRAGRERLDRLEGGFIAHDSGRCFTAEELAAEIRAHAQDFTPDALLRPVVESYVFPTLAYVGGAAEVAYWGQIGSLFDAFDIRMPIVFPRYSATVTPDAAERARSFLGLPAEALALPEHALLERLAREHLPAEVRDRLSALRSALVEGFGGVAEAAREIDVNLIRAISARRNRVLLEVGGAERSIIRHLKKRRPELLQTLRMARNHLVPNDLPQERVLTVLPYLSMDTQLLTRLADEMTVELRSTA